MVDEMLAISEAHLATDMTSQEPEDGNTPPRRLASFYPLMPMRKATEAAT